MSNAPHRETHLERLPAVSLPEVEMLHEMLSSGVPRAAICH